MRDWLARRAQSTPSATALVDASSGDRWTFGQLDERVEALAGRLSALGVGDGDHLGVAARPGPSYVEVVHAAVRVGAVLVPLHARLTAAEFADVGARADVTAVLCDSTTEGAAVDAFDRGPAGGGAVGAGAEGAGATDDEPTSHGSVDATDSVPVATLDEPDHGARAVDSLDPEPFDRPQWSGERTLLLLATSGTTGEPKLVALTAANLLFSAAASSWRLGVLPSDRWYCVLPMSHMGGLAPVFRCVLYGTTVVAATPGSFDPMRALEEMHAHEVTGVSLVPATLSRLLDEGEFPDSLRFVLLGGAAAPEELVERSLDRGIPVCPTYGATETASQIATARPEDAAAAPGTVGHPLVFADVTVADEEGRPVEPRTPGELVVSGPTVAPGYYGDAEATEAAFGPHGFHTGDVGYRDDDGRVHVSGRLDDRIVTGGETVDPSEVAGVLREHPAVEDAFVTSLPDAEYGQRVAALVAGDVSPDELEDHVPEALARFKLPRQWAVVDELPRTASGTVDREAARSLLLEE